MIAYHQIKFGCQRINSSENVLVSHILIIRALAVTLTLKTTFLFRMTLWFILLHHRTRFGNKTFCGSEDIIQTNIH